MTNEKIQQKVLERLKSVLGVTPSEYYNNKAHPKIFGKISKRATYEVAKGNFTNEWVGELGLMKLEKYFNELEKTNEDGQNQ